MNRRTFLKGSVLAAGFTTIHPWPLIAENAPTADWLARWKEHILAGSRDRYCDREMGEEIGWLISPFLNGFYYGYMATGDPVWVQYLADWADSWIKRGVKDPGGFIGWPKQGQGIGQGNGVLMDSLLGEAMGFRPLLLMAKEILHSPALEKTYGARAYAWRDLSQQTFSKWLSFDCWREVKDGGLWVVPAFGIDPKTGQWTDGYSQRATTGFSNPDNKQNLIALWLLAMFDLTKEDSFKGLAEKWFRLMKSRMKTREDGKYLVWNYWEPAGPWDYAPDGSTRHWVGVHPNGGYYGIDVQAIVAAYEHNLVFTREDLNRLVATNRDFMWNQQIKGAKFQRIDGGDPDPRWKDNPGELWTALIPYDATLRKIFIQNHNPDTWAGLSATPWFLALAK